MEVEPATLVMQAQEGDVNAFEALVRRYQNLALASALDVARDRHLAQDAVQEGFVAAWLRLSELREPAAFGAWLRRVVRRCAFRVGGGKTRPALGPNGDDSPVEQLARQEKRDLTTAAVFELPAGLREVVLLYYMEERSQAEVAAFVGIPVSTVNNRLHEARLLLKGRLEAMVSDGIKEEALPGGFAERIGEIVRVAGNVVEVQARSVAPELFGRLTAGGADMSVIQRLKDGRVRCLTEENLPKPGDPAHAESTHPHAQFSDDAMREAVNEIGGPRPEKPALLETGIKVVDLLCPYVKGGVVGFFGTQGVGRVVLEQELRKRVRDARERLTVAYFMQGSEAGLLQHLLRFPGHNVEDADDGVQTVWLLTPLATEPEYAGGLDYLDAATYFDPLLATRTLYPAVDSALSGSRLLREQLVSKEHAETAAAVRHALAGKSELLADVKTIDLVARRAYAGARRRHEEHTAARLKELSKQERELVTRAQRLEMYFTQPFYVAEHFNGFAGVSVPLEQTIADCRAILEGEADGLDLEKMRWGSTLAAMRA